MMPSTWWSDYVAMLFERVPDAEREEVFIVQMRSAKLSNGLNKNK